METPQKFDTLVKTTWIIKIWSWDNRCSCILMGEQFILIPIEFNCLLWKKAVKHVIAFHRVLFSLHGNSHSMTRTVWYAPALGINTKLGGGNGFSRWRHLG